MHVDVNQPEQNNAGEQGEQEAQEAQEVQEIQSEEQPTKSRYRIEWKKLVLLIGALVLLAAIVFGVWWFFWGRDKKDDPVMVYDVAVMLKDQNQKDPEEDLKSSLKAGDVVLTRETGREWSNTERISYLILKMKLKQSEAAKLTEPETKKLSEKEAKEKGLIPEERGEREEEMEKEELEQRLIQTVRARKYRINIEDMDFDISQVRNGQPFPDKEFGWGIVEKKGKIK